MSLTFFYYYFQTGHGRHGVCYCRIVGHIPAELYLKKTQKCLISLDRLIGPSTGQQHLTTDAGLPLLPVGLCLSQAIYDVDFKGD